MSCFNEYSELEVIAVRSATSAFSTEDRIQAQWQSLRFHEPPALNEAIEEHTRFVNLLTSAGAEILELEGHEEMTLDSIYTRDALIISPSGTILCRMGRASRQEEPGHNSRQLAGLGFPVSGEISAPGTLEGGDFIWLDEHTAAVGLGPRTNQEGIRQLQRLLGEGTELHVVPLVEPEHPDDVFHLMSMISPLDHDLALIYRPLMPAPFIRWLESRGIGFVEVPEAEFLLMGCNVLATGPRRILMLDKLPATRSLLMDAGCEVSTFKGDEISRKGGGGPTCLTRPLARANN